MANVIQIKRGSGAPPSGALAECEFGFDLVSNNLYIGTSNGAILLAKQGAAANVQSDWNVTDSSSDAFVKNKPTIPTVPTNVSAFTNDAGYLTQHQDISGKADKATTYTKTEVDTALGQKADTNHNHDSRYYTETEVDNLLDDKADTNDIPTKTSELTNDSGFLTQHQDISGKADQTYVDINCLNRCTRLYSGTLSTSTTIDVTNYKFLVCTGKATSKFCNVIIPLNWTSGSFNFTDEVNFGSFDYSRTGNTVTITYVGGSKLSYIEGIS